MMNIRSSKKSNSSSKDALDIMRNRRREMSANLFSSFPRHYISRKTTHIISDSDLPFEKNSSGITTPVGIFLLLIRLTTPFAYIYTTLIVLRKICEVNTTTNHHLYRYIPTLSTRFQYTTTSSSLFDLWVLIEVFFHLYQKLHVRWLQSMDPIEAALSTTPFMEPSERANLWQQIMHQLDMEEDPVAFITNWFFGLALEDITQYDIMDLVTWSMFEERNQEHLTDEEVELMKVFVEELERKLSYHLYEEKGERWDTGNDGHEKGKDSEVRNTMGPKWTSVLSNGLVVDEAPLMDSRSEYSLDREVNSKVVSKFDQELHKRAKPRKEFCFRQTIHEETHFLPPILSSFHPPNLQDIRTFVYQENQQLHQVRKHAAECSRTTTTSKNIKSRVESDTTDSNINRGFDNADTIHDLDKCLLALGDETHRQLDEVWGSVCRMRERLDLQQQLERYRVLLVQMRNASATMPMKQMAEMLQKITKCTESLVQVERSALSAFWNATESGGGYLRRGLNEPQRYVKPSFDPLLGLETYPLAFHLSMYGVTDGLLRFMMSRRGFQRLTIASTTYYYHPGLAVESTNNSDDDDTETDDIPIVFCHGIGIGLCVYLPLIDELLKNGQPIFLPEIPYVCGFRPWLSHNSVLTPTAVTSTITAMLASHNFLKATFIGHSYGTSWLSYVCKYANHTVAAVLFLDPICFCLHHSNMTKSFVYHRADPGNIGHMVKTDLIINWTLQRRFLWTRAVLFVEDIPADIPCGVYISEKDLLVPVATVENYFRKSGVPIIDFQKGDTIGKEERLNVVVFRGDAHGDWCTQRPALMHIANTTRMLTRQYKDNQK